MKVDLEVHRKARIDMLPLIDIVFLLLVFFIYAMLSMAVHHALPVVLPVSSTAPLDKQVTLSVTIDHHGAVFLDQEPVERQHLAERLREKTGDAKAPAVLLFADNRITYQTLYGVIDQIKIAGIDRLSLECERQP
ncbi:biopolymer transporter ExbD [Desulfosarcina alkanivorans]|uniref:Biopolymer transporter ExbD n=1 Tax=Desulfosarcina alkanivorans TaxID=571177 RepID=A0A5K7YSI4_9BACT|nr:biopolymer transporter ExbD [Desulfosarcina alkanivorans]BBO67607.1 biopolymer transporter ExbD [Desulfosarcina alkanivorans]